MDAELVVVSPHFDDAVLSVGSLIGARAAAGQPVQVLTVYSAGPPTARAGRRRVFGDYATRRAEDDRALAVLGATARRLGLRERLFRDPAPSRPIDVFRTPPRAEGLSELATVERLIAELLAERAREILVPLGIGNHCDHVEVAVAAMRVAARRDCGDRVRFYEDFNALSELCRRRHPVARTEPFPWRSAPAWASPISGLAVEAMALAARGPAAPRLAGHTPGPGDTAWVMQVVPVGVFESAQLRAVAEYHSQLPALGGAAQVIRMIRRSHRCRGGEILWHMRPEVRRCG